MTKPLRYDFHVHSHHSYDSMTTPARIVRAAQRRGLAGVAVTDHGTIAGGLETQRLAPPNLLVIVGVEVHTTVGDIVCLFLSREIVGKDPIDVIAQTHAQGGVAFFPHPLRSHPPLVPAEVLQACDGFEVLNSRAGWFDPNSSPSRGSDWRKLVGKARLGNSDSHLASEIGASHTVIEGPATEDNIKQAFREARTAPGGHRVPSRNFYLSQLIKMVKTRDASMLARLAKRSVRRLTG
ncbi:MAG: PHP domain-containing protein [Gemmatimonadaceae bacterium]